MARLSLGKTHAFLAFLVIAVAVDSPLSRGFVWRRHWAVRAPTITLIVAVGCWLGALASQCLAITRTTTVLLLWKRRHISKQTGSRRDVIGKGASRTTLGPLFTKLELRTRPLQKPFLVLSLWSMASRPDMRRHRLFAKRQIWNRYSGGRLGVRRPPQR